LQYDVTIPVTPMSLITTPQQKGKEYLQEQIETNRDPCRSRQLAQYHLAVLPCNVIRSLALQPQTERE
jgi:hypothetical protein